MHTYTTMIDMVEPKFMGDLPYVIAMVDLEEGVRMTTRIVNCSPDDVAIDMKVEVFFEDVSPECALPMFQPADPSLRLIQTEDGQQEAATPVGKPAMGPETYQTIEYEIGKTCDGECTITLNRPEKHNAINRQMAAELIDAFRTGREQDKLYGNDGRGDL